MHDRIEIKDLLLRGILGTNADERVNKQDVLLNLQLMCDTSAAGESDDIEDTVNYRTLAKRVIKLVEGSKFHLVEKLAEEVARLCLEDPAIVEAVVSVEKPGALRFARSVGVTIRRQR